jgi:tetratricopeptide (TPR) repeat protein
MPRLRQSADAAGGRLCQIAGVMPKMARVLAAFAAAVAMAVPAFAQRNAVESWDPSARTFGQPDGQLSGQLGVEDGLSTDRRSTTIEALDKILSSSRLSAFDRSVYLSIRAYQFNRVGRQADSQKDIAEMGKVLPSAWPLVLSGTVPELAGGGDRAAALRTLDAALQQKPGDIWLVIAQAQVHMQIADFDRALALLDEALAGPTTPADRRIAFYYRGHARFNLGQYVLAAEDFEAALAGRTTLKARLGPLLWRYAALVRAKRDGRSGLVRELGNESLSDWAGPIAAFLIGRLPAGQLEVVAETDDDAKKANGKCPSAFFIAMDALRRNDRKRAREQLQLAQARCPTISEVNWAAASELQRL